MKKKVVTIAELRIKGRKKGMSINKYSNSKAVFLKRFSSHRSDIRVSVIGKQCLWNESPRINWSTNSVAVPRFEEIKVTIFALEHKACTLLITLSRFKARN